MSQGDKIQTSDSMLSDSAERLRAIFDTAVECIITISSEGIVEAFNNAAQKLFGYAPGEVIGRNVKMLMPSPFREEHDAYIANYLNTGKAKIIGIGREAVGKRKDGTTFPMKLAVSEVKLADRILFTGFIEDLTERKRFEKEAEEARDELERRVEARTAELARANEELEHFAHTISHDLRTPLRGIRNYVDFIMEDMAGKVVGESAADLKRLGRATDELERMIQELLNYTRIGRVESSPQNIDTRQMIQSIVGDIGPRDGREVVINGKLPMIFAPQGTVRQIFQNLIENGLQYNKSNPRRVEISASRVDEDSGRWLFAFRDNGIGIDPQYHQKIFGMFKRLHSDEDYPGTGIGLAAVRKALQHLGGSIRVESEVGKGSTFWVELPNRGGAKEA
ncbi:PAS domain S-box protein [Candidatus Sumerlaeota bacterium]|nr:PAS domain S-box protein [Candidatus Sumerlaeota bacterium]